MNAVRCILLWLLISCFGLTQAEESNWLLSEPGPANESGTVESWRGDNSFSTVRKVGGALAIVLGLFFLYAVLNRGGRVTPASHKLLQSLGSVQITPGVRLHLVQLGTRILVLHIAGSNVQRVAEIDDAAEVERMLCASGAQEPISVSKSVEELLKKQNAGQATLLGATR